MYVATVHNFFINRCFLEYINCLIFYVFYDLFYAKCTAHYPMIYFPLYCVRLSYIIKRYWIFDLIQLMRSTEHRHVRI